MAYNPFDEVIENDPAYKMQFGGVQPMVIPQQRPDYTQETFKPVATAIAQTYKLLTPEQETLDQIEKDQQSAAVNINRYGLSYMDIPPFNCQSPMMVSMMQKLFNIPSTFVVLQNFTMYDKTGKAYTPAQGGTPVT